MIVLIIFCLYVLFCFFLGTVHIIINKGFVILMHVRINDKIERRCGVV